MNVNIIVVLHHIKMMLKIILYIYSRSVCFGSKIEKLLYNRIRMIWLSQNQTQNEKGNFYIISIEIAFFHLSENFMSQTLLMLYTCYLLCTRLVILINDMTHYFFLDFLGATCVFLPLLGLSESLFFIASIIGATSFLARLE